MKKDMSVKLIGVAIAVIGFGLSMIQKQLDDKKLEDLIQSEVQKQLKNL